MPEQPKSPAGPRDVRAWWITGGVILAAIIVVAIVFAANSGAPRPGPDTGTSSGPSTSPVSPSPSVSEPAPTDGSSPPAPTVPGQPGPTTGPIDEPAEALPGVEVSITDLDAVDGEAQGPGEVSGPSVRFTVTITNDTASAVSLQTTVVTLDFGTDRTPASELQEPGGSPLGAQVAPGETIRGVYLFRVPVDERELVRITVDYSVDVAPMVFEGPAPR